MDRVAWWLDDKELTSRWFGHYACDDPAHRGYDPQHMIESAEWEWQIVMNDPARLIYSIHNVSDDHIGECQVLPDREGGAELSLLIGRRDLWHLGYGTATVIELLDKTFGEMGLERAWVSVPVDNEPAMGLFSKLGFTKEQTVETCTRADGTALKSCIMAATARAYLQPQAREAGNDQLPVVTVTGLPGSASEEVAAEVARVLGRRVIDEEIVKDLSESLKCSPNEIAAFEAGYRSFWSRLLNAFVVPMEGAAVYDSGFQWAAPSMSSTSQDILDDFLTKEKYVDGLRSVVKKFAAEGDTVIHGHGSHLFKPGHVETLNVFVNAAEQSRVERIASGYGMTEDEARKWIRRSDKDVGTVCKGLLDCDLMDLEQYDFTINVDRLSVKAAAQMIVGALQAEVPARQTVATTKDTGDTPAIPIS